MKLLLFSDVHADAVAIRRIVERSRDVDVAIGAGDFCNMRRGLTEAVQPLTELACPLVVVPGNAESYEELDQAFAGASDVHVLHGSGCTIADVPFFGLGGAVPETPFGAWSYDLSEDEARRRLAECPNGGILVTHSPPKGWLDHSTLGASLGSVAILETLNRCLPRLLVCGHIHQCAGRMLHHGATTLVNAGPRGIVWTLPG